MEEETKNEVPNNRCFSLGMDKKTKRDPEDVRKYTIRLNKIEGQIRGIKRMLENDAYCPDILTQTAATISALKSFSREILSHHLHTCVADDIKSGNDEILDELLFTIYKLLK